MEESNVRRRRSIVALLHNEITAWLVLAISLAITALGWHVGQLCGAPHQRPLQLQSQRRCSASANRMLEYEQVLQRWPSSMPWSVPRRVPNGALSSSGCGFRNISRHPGHRLRADASSRPTRPAYRPRCGLKASIPIR